MAKQFSKAISFFIFSKRYWKMFLRAVKYAALVSRRNYVGKKIIFVNKKCFPFTIFQIELWQDYQKCILLVQRNVLMLEHFRKEYDFLIFFETHWNMFKQGCDPCIICVQRKIFGKKCSFFVNKICFLLQFLR